MKNQVLTFAIATGFAAILANTSAVAQTPHTATIPFAFQAGNTEYPSGTYMVTRTEKGAAVIMTNTETLQGFFVMLPVPAGQASSGAKLVFNSSPEGYRLSEVWLHDAPGMKTYNASKNKEAASVKVAVH